MLKWVRIVLVGMFLMYGVGFVLMMVATALVMGYAATEGQ